MELASEQERPLVGACQPKEAAQATGEPLTTVWLTFFPGRLAAANRELAES